MMTPKDIQNLFQIFHDLDPSPKGELNHINPYTLLVAVILSARMTDKGVNNATEKLFKIVHTPSDALELGAEGLTSYLKTIGLHPTKIKNILRTSQILIDSYEGHLPRSKEDLQQLPGVGPKTASVLMNSLYNHPSIAVDTHVFRVSNRLGLASATTPEKMEKQLDKVVPDNYKVQAHHWLVLHGRYICKLRKPLCKICPVRHLCDYYSKILST